MKPASKKSKKSGMAQPVMKKKCATCPFRIDDNGRLIAPSVAKSVSSRLMETSQICHAPRIYGKPETQICRGARDIQLTIFHRLGMLSAPTDEAWERCVIDYKIEVKEGIHHA